MASYQRTAHDVAQAAAAEDTNGVFPFLYMLGLRAVVLFEGQVCVKPRAVLSRIHKVAAGFDDLPRMETSSNQWWADWSGALEEARRAPTAPSVPRGYLPGLTTFGSAPPSYLRPPTVFWPSGRSSC